MPEDVKKLNDLMPTIKEQLRAGGSVRFSPNGTSMRPMLRQGKDTVVLSPLPEQLKPFDLPLYQRDNGQYVLHRIIAVEDQGFTCVGDNQVQLEYGVRQDQMIGLVTAFYRGKKEWSVSSLSYRIYCRFWHGTRSIRRVWRKLVVAAIAVLKFLLGKDRRK